MLYRLKSALTRNRVRASEKNGAPASSTVSPRKSPQSNSNQRNNGSDSSPKSSRTRDEPEVPPYPASHSHLNNSNPVPQQQIQQVPPSSRNSYDYEPFVPPMVYNNYSQYGIYGGTSATVIPASSLQNGPVTAGNGTTINNYDGAERSYVPTRKTVTRSPSVQSSHQGDGEISGRGSALPPHNNEPEVVTMKLQKSNSGMGLSIVAARGVGQDKLGIYIKSVVKGGAADQDGRLQAGDQLLKVDGNSLVGISQEKAAELMTRTGPVVTLEVAKQGAIYHGLAALLSQPSPVMQRGGGSHPGPRRMSERDIPARIVQDQNHVGGPRMQGSKSVPSLNSEPQIAPVAKPGTEQHYPIGPEPHARHKSGPVQTISRPESTHPQYDPRYQTYGHSSVNPAGQGGTNGPMVNGRHPQHYPQQLTPQQQQALAEERHYQNIGMYQQAGPYSQRPLQQGYGGPQGQQPGPQRPLHGSHSSLLRTTDPAYHHHHHSGQNNSQTMSPSPLDRSRPLSTLVSPREQEQYVNSLNYSNAPQNPSPHHRVNQNQSSGTGSWPRQESLRQSVNYGHRADYRGQTEITEEPDLVGPKSGVIYGQVPQMDSRQRDLLRQEAKMEEMREEVRRREERGDQSGRVSQPNWGPGPNHHVGGPIPASATVVRQGHPTQYATYGSQPFLGGPQHHPRAPGQQSGPPPPTVPKPRPQMQQQQQPQQPWPPGYDGQPDDRHVIYRDSPPPPPPPSSTHPLMQHGPGGPSPAVSYRYGPSGYPPRPNDGATPQDAPGPQPRTAPQPAIRTTPGNGDVPRAASATYGKPNLNQSRMMPDVARVAQVQNQDKKEFGITSPSPWEREEKEKLRKQKLDEARRIRDRDIRELESLPNRTQKQEDCLRALRLEQEFQRRAEEMSNHGDDDEDDDELLDRAENRERILRMQEDLARTRQRRLDWEQEQLQQQQQQQQQHKPKVPEQINQQPNHHNHDQVQDTEGRLHHLRLEEVNRKKELEATKLAEERLLREARRRQEEDYQSGGYIQKNSHNSSGPQRLDTLLTTTTTTTNAQNDIPPALPTSPPPPLENEYHHGNHFEQPNNSGAQRLESLLLQGGGGHSQNMDQKSGAPPPPERKASYDLHNSSQSSIRYTGVLRNGDINHPPPTMQKKVSFHDARLETEINERKNSSTNNDSSYTLDDIDEALDLGNNQVSSASLVLNTSGQSSVLNTSIGSTPGVIGAQEVYRDPRQRIEAERYQMMGQTGARNNLGPEKLSFREKMKMFALETGQDDTPKDKVKISRAQREIETKTTTNNGAIAAATQS